MNGVSWHDYDFDPRGKHMSHVWKRSDECGAIIVAKGALEGYSNIAISMLTRAIAPSKLMLN